MHFLDVGQGPPVLLLHGAPGAAASFAPLAAALAGRRALAPDLPGYGRSPPLPPPYTLEKANAALEDELLSRNVASAAVVGHSLGGYRALLLALTGRVRVTRLFLLGAFAGLDAEARAGYAQLAALLRNPGFDPMPLWRERAFAPSFAREHPQGAERALGLVNSVSREVLASELETLAELTDLRPRLGELRIPVHLRVGALDAALPLARSEEIARAVPGATLEIVPGRGHLLLDEDGEATIASIARVV